MLFSLPLVSQTRQPTLPEPSYPCPAWTGENMGSLSSVPLEPVPDPQAQHYHAKKMLFTYLEGSFQHYILPLVSSPNPMEKWTWWGPQAVLEELWHSQGPAGQGDLLLTPLRWHQPSLAGVVALEGTASWHPGTTDKQLNPLVAFGFIIFVNVRTIIQPYCEKMV